MHRRLYFLFPDVLHTKRVVDELLLKRIDIRHIHVVPPENMEVGDDLPIASLFQRSDVRHSLIIGSLIGGVLGVVVGVITHYVLGLSYGGIMIAITITGALLGAWSSSMFGMMTPNSELKPFMKSIEQGQLLLMVDIPHSHVDEINELIEKLHPEAKAKGVEPTLPSFP